MKNQDELVIGDWWAACCIHDLCLIKNEDDLNEAKTFSPFFGGWDNYQCAHNELMHAWNDDE